MTSSARLDDLHQKFREDPRRYFAPLANEYRKSGDAARAVELCRAHLPQQPGHLSGHVVLAQALHDLGDLEGARQAYAAALALDGENVLVIRSMGDVERQAGSVDRARDWYERAMGVDPRDPEVARRLAALEQEPRMAEPPREPEPAVAPPEPHQPREPHEPPPVELDEAAELVTERILREELEEEAAEERDESRQASLADVPDEGEDREAAEFTAGFFAAVLASPTPDEPAPQAVDAGETLRDEAPEFEAGGTDEIDRLFAELPPLDQGFALPEPQAMDATPLPPGSDLALADGGAVVPEVTGVTEPSATYELPGTGAVEDFGLLPPDVTEPSGARAGTDEDPVPLVADEWTMSLDSAAFEPEPSDYSATSSMPEAPVEEFAAPAEPDEAPLVEVAADGFDVSETFEVAAEVPAEEIVAEQARVADELAVVEPQPLAAAETARVAEIAGHADAVHPEAFDDDAHVPVESGVAFVTETMAELYVRQGFSDQALQVYRQLVAERPDDERLRARMAELERSLAAPAADDGGSAGKVVAAGVAVAGVAAAGLAAARFVAGRRAGGDEAPAASWLARLAKARPTVETAVVPEVAPDAIVPDASAPEAVESSVVEHAAAEPAVVESAAAEPEVVEPSVEEYPEVISVDAGTVSDAHAVDVDAAADRAARSMEAAAVEAAAMEAADAAAPEAIDDVAPEYVDVVALESVDAVAPEASREVVDAAEPDLVPDAALEPAAAWTPEPEAAFEWGLPEPAAEAVARAEEESSAEAVAGPVAATPEAPAPETEAEDDPWLFEGELLAARGADPVAGEPSRHHVADEAPLIYEPVAGVPVAPEAEVREPEGGEPAVTLDALFARPVPAAEELAAGALAAATVSLQEDPAVEAQLQEATMEDPAALQHLLRGTPRSVAALRHGASFSFDQFFRVDEPAPATGGARGEEEPPRAPRPEAGAPADEGAESDLADFHAWLSGLSKP